MDIHILFNEWRHKQYCILHKAQKITYVLNGDFLTNLFLCITTSEHVYIVAQGACQTVANATAVGTTVNVQSEKIFAVLSFRYWEGVMAWLVLLWDTPMDRLCIRISGGQMRIIRTSLQQEATIVCALIISSPDLQQNLSISTLLSSGTLNSIHLTYLLTYLLTYSME